MALLRIFCKRALTTATKSPHVGPLIKNQEFNNFYHIIFHEAADAGVGGAGVGAGVADGVGFNLKRSPGAALYRNVPVQI